MVASLFRPIDRSPSKVLRDQIRDAVRELIDSGKLLAGERIPSTRELAQTWQTDVRTVHAGLSVLVKEGRLVRHHGKGTFVRKRTARLTRVGIYYRSDIWLDASAGFYRKVHEALQELLRTENIELDTWVDPRPADQQGAPWDALLRAVKAGRIQAVVMAGTDPTHLPWQTTLPVPVAILANGVPRMVGIDLGSFVKLSVAALAAQGCRSLGLITAVGSETPEFFQAFVDCCRDCGVTVRNEWVVTPQGRNLQGQSQEGFGFESFRGLWNQPERPDGLVIYPDSVARGVIPALLEREARVPQELQLAVHKNERVDLFCPIPATFVILRESDIAAALWEQIQREFRGDDRPPSPVGFSVSTAFRPEQAEP